MITKPQVYHHDNQLPIRAPSRASLTLSPSSQQLPPPPPPQDKRRSNSFTLSALRESFASQSAIVASPSVAAASPQPPTTPKGVRPQGYASVAAYPPPPPLPSNSWKDFQSPTTSKDLSYVIDHSGAATATSTAGSVSPQPPEKRYTPPPTWIVHPVGRKMVKSILAHCERYKDLQTLAVISCVLANPPPPEVRSFAHSFIRAIANRPSTEWHVVCSWLE